MSMNHNRNKFKKGALEAAQAERTAARAKTREASANWKRSRYEKYRGNNSFVGEKILRSAGGETSLGGGEDRDEATVVVNENIADGLGVGKISSFPYDIFLL